MYNLHGTESYNLHPITRRNPEARPQGVYELISPPGSSPAGCNPTFGFRFGFIPQPATSAFPPVHPIVTVCDDPNKLSMNLRGGILTDKQGRIGSIVANRQFQFDGPPAQAGAIYTAGWSICPNQGVLALGPSMDFYRCKSGDFYNIYDQSIGGQCERIWLTITKVVQC
ncbi:hypothetical protein BZA05DRAFT_425290 [Tricharina praecox]|uniref:uncharacterized protein n=1 Tax=Tricharina praecox TaxID=43433 RepID=UPI002220EBDF|nr:uncharacterized protein BZA05DRAFT_425290 [Tricharina praecox]KAI5854055.1 hypothetical protein BZA05DRAFT_425290 [Tricharina praecox]